MFLGVLLLHIESISKIEVNDLQVLIDRQSASMSIMWSRVPSLHALLRGAECPDIGDKFVMWQRKTRVFLRGGKDASTLMGVVNPIEPRAALCGSFL